MASRRVRCLSIKEIEQVEDSELAVAIRRQGHLVLASKMDLPMHRWIGHIRPHPESSVSVFPLAADPPKNDLAVEWSGGLMARLCPTKATCKEEK